MSTGYNSEEEIQRTRLDMNRKTLEPAHGERDDRPRAKPVEINEWPLRIVPRVDVFFSALLNTVNNVVETLRKDKIDVIENGEHVNLSLPLSRKNGGIATKSVENIFTFLSDLNLSEYLILGSAETVTSHIESLLATIQEQLAESFYGEPIEMEGFDFVIDRRDYFKVSTHTEVVTKSDANKQTVNEVQLVVSVIIHAASLTHATDEDGLNKSYVATIRNCAKGTGIDARTHVLFDVGNFSERASLLELFRTLMVSEQFISVGAVDPKDFNEANTSVRLNPKI